MTPIEDRLLGFVLGVLTGWVARWLLQRWRERRRPPMVRREGLADAFAPVAPPATEPAALSASEVSAHVRVIDVGAARAAGFNIRHMEDLTIIEGIGPRIDDLLHANGIVSFADLAVQRVEDLVAMLDRGGANFRLANPESWPRQAQLAADNQWTDLKRLQRDMIGGLPPAEPRD